MKNLLTIPFVMAILFAQGQTALSSTDKLKSLCRVWGFLKYHHPAPASGKIDWDAQLIIYEDKVGKASSGEELSAIYLEWISSLGDIASRKSQTGKDELFIENFDTSWFHQSGVFTDHLIDKLSYIYRNRVQGHNYYADKHYYQISFEHEKPYQGMDFPDSSYRLLTLFRYWNIINYYYPSKYLIGKDWGTVLDEMVPLFQQANTPVSYHVAVLKLISSIHDGHASYFNRYIWQFYGPKLFPFGIKVIGDEAIVVSTYSDSLAKIDDIRVGDVIRKINDTSVGDLVRLKWDYIPASNDGGKIRNSGASITYGFSDSATIQFERNGYMGKKTVHRYGDFRLFNKPLGTNNYIIPDAYKLFDGNIGYINLSKVHSGKVDEIFESFQHCKGVIIDLRNYPNGDVLKPVSDKIHHDRVAFMKSLMPIYDDPGKFYFDSSNSEEKTGNAGGGMYRGQVVILMDEGTQSMGEMACMMLTSEPGVKSVGHTTAGADGAAVPVTLPGGYPTAISGIGIYYPDGRVTQRKGIQPDIEVSPTVAGIRAGKDEVLEKAIALIAHE